MEDVDQWYQRIDDLVRERERGSDEQILAELSNLAPLPDEEDDAWQHNEVWDEAGLYIALTDVAQIRALEAAVPLIMEQASYGDPEGIMRNIFKNVIAHILSGDIAKYYAYASSAVQSPRAGTRLWAVDMLGYSIPTYPEARDLIRPALNDSHELVREEAQVWLT